VSTPPTTNRAWLRRVRALRDRATREREGLLFVEGIRQVLAAEEGRQPLEAVLVDPSRLRSAFGWELIDRIQHTGVPIVMLAPAEFESISSRDNPVGLAAIVHWQPARLAEAHVEPDDLWLLVDDIRDPGNLGTLIRTADALGAAGVVVHRGVDAAHPTVARASLGTLFRTRLYLTHSFDELFAWTGQHGVTTVATSAHAEEPLGQTATARPLGVLLGSEGEGLDTETIARCDLAVRIPMHGTASSLNVSVAAGIVLYALRRR
jgi:TrmH family RNA methyltransferase